jgi:hypothetical protein
MVVTSASSSPPRASFTRKPIIQVLQIKNANISRGTREIFFREEASRQQKLTTKGENISRTLFRVILR